VLLTGVAALFTRAGLSVWPEEKLLEQSLKGLWEIAALAGKVGALPTQT
jgi:hypothetical protein